MYAQEYGVDAGASFVTRMLILELAELDVYDKRLTVMLADPKYATMVEENPIGIDEITNEPIMRKEISKFFEVKEKIQNRKLRLHTELVGTPRELIKKKALLKERDETDHAVKAARTREEFEQLIPNGNVKS